MATKQRQSIQIDIGTPEYVSGTNRYRLDLKGKQLDLEGKRPKLTLKEYSLFNSSYNISSSIGNNTYSIRWVDSSVRSFTIPDGTYSFSDLATLFLYHQTQSKLYVVSTTDSSKIQTFITCAPNSIQYAADITICYVPTSLSGYSLPANCGWTLPTTNPVYPQLILCSGLQRMFGFKSQSTFPVSQTVPSPAVNKVFTSNTYPVIQTTNAYRIGTNLMFSPFNQNHHIFASIPITKSFGQVLQSTNQTIHLLDCVPQKFSYIDIEIYDQNGLPVVPLDPEANFSIFIEFDE